MQYVCQQFACISLWLPCYLVLAYALPACQTEASIPFLSCMSTKQPKLVYNTCAELMTNISCLLPCWELISYTFVMKRGTLLTSRTTVRVVFAGSIELWLIIDVLKSMSSETRWKSQLTVHMVVNLAAVGTIYVANPAIRFGWLVVKHTKQCVGCIQKYIGIIIK